MTYHSIDLLHHKYTVGDIAALHASSAEGTLTFWGIILPDENLL